MKTQLKTRSRMLGLLEAALLGAVLAAIVAIGADRARPPEAGMQAWSDRLQAQAETYRQVRMWQAWTGRLNGPAEERVSAAYAARLTALARERADEAYAARLAALAQDRTWDAWTARLNGLAEAYVANR
ncbi:MAG: hypothetical protein H6Q36_730 [Chloroflexi bacterium]|jgi:hypothetical protein|nr:hypothetical protein [Chloroflexota bacterium]